jgi:hypothetical protein
MHQIRSSVEQGLSLLPSVQINLWMNWNPEERSLSSTLVGISSIQQHGYCALPSRTVLTRTTRAARPMSLAVAALQ